MSEFTLVVRGYEVGRGVKPVFIATKNIILPRIPVAGDYIETIWGRDCKVLQVEFKLDKRIMAYTEMLELEDLSSDVATDLKNSGYYLNFT